MFLKSFPNQGKASYLTRVPVAPRMPKKREAKISFLFLFISFIKHNT